MNKKKRNLLIVATIIIILAMVSSYANINNNVEMDSIKNNSVVVEKGRFQNIEPTKVMQGMSRETFREYFRKGEKSPKQALPMIDFNANEYMNAPSELSVVWFGHSSALIELGGKFVLTDPALSNNAGPTSFTGTTRFHKALPVSIGDLPNLDVVLLSHDHFDHLDKSSIKELNAKTKQFIVPLGVGKYLTKWGVQKTKIQEMGWWETFEMEGMQFISTPARHFSGRGLFDRNTTLWSSYVIAFADKKVYFSGDSGYQAAFKEIGEKYGPFDLSLLECGQYNQDWSLIHMSPEESVQAGLDVNSKLALPIHWGAFNLSVHAWYEPVERFVKEAKKQELNYITPLIGKRIIVDENTQTEAWWLKHKQENVSMVAE